MTQRRAIRVLVAMPGGSLRDAVEAVLESVGHFTIVGRVDVQSEIQPVFVALDAEVLVLDLALDGADATRIAQSLAAEQPIPTLLVVGDEARTLEDTAAIDRHLRLFRIDKERLATHDEGSIRTVQTTINLFAASSREHRARATQAELSGILGDNTESRPEPDDAFDRPRRRPTEPSAPAVAFLVGASAHAAAVPSLLAVIKGSRASVVVCLEGSDAHIDVVDRCTLYRIAVQTLDRTVSFEDLGGICIAHSGRRMIATARSLLVGHELDPGLVVTETLKSLAAMGRGALVVAFAPIEIPILRALEEHVEDGGIGYVLRSDADDACELAGIPTIDAAGLGVLLRDPDRRAPRVTA